MIEKEGLEKKLPNFPSEATENVLKTYIDFLKSEPYNAVDFTPELNKADHKPNFVIKYAGGITLYYKTTKIGGIGVKVKKNKQ